ncbi:hypothetical protein C8Q76DRAFT_706604 [Earliella scabrosa]|nr:hypothetical protein C8Q76DRAFT_706604 [Earliella scabrosa]
MANRGEAFDVFCGDFFHLPSIKASTLPVSSNPFVLLKHADNMSGHELTTRFVTAVNDNGLAPGLVMRFCGDRPNPSMFDEAQKTDVAFYRKEVVVADDERAPWGDQILPVVFTASNLVSDTYHDTPVRNSSKTVAMRKRTWQGQSLACGEFLMAVQQRHMLFHPICADEMD